MASDPVDNLNSAVTDTTLDDRRRPGRPADVSPELVPLLRGSAKLGIDPSHDLTEESDPLSTARGSVLAVLLSAVAWAGIGLVAWLLH